MSRLRTVFFDLDHTLWDYESNASDTLTDLFHKYELEKYYSGINAFLNSFHYHNDRLWHKYNHGLIDREFIRKNRFYNMLVERGQDSQELAIEMSDFFVSEGPKRNKLIEGAISVLERLADKYKLGIISNGFEDTQDMKLESSGIKHYFQWVITSESAGSRKPSKEIFDHALATSKNLPGHVKMIGDNYETDILGAKNAGWESIWYNPLNTAKFAHKNQVKKLIELLDLI